MGTVMVEAKATTAVAAVMLENDFRVIGRGLEKLDASESLDRLGRGRGDQDDIPTYHDYPIEESPSVYIGRLVLAQAAFDAVKFRDCEDRRDAREFLTTDSTDLRFICGMARVNPEYLLKVWRGRLQSAIEQDLLLPAAMLDTRELRRATRCEVIPFQVAV